MQLSERLAAVQVERSSDARDVQAEVKNQIGRAHV